MAHTQQKIVAALVLTTVSVLVATLAWPPASAPQTGRYTIAAATTAVAHCRFQPGETAAFTLESKVRDVRSEDVEDHFKGTLSWQAAEALSPTSWRLRAALSGVSHTQALTLPEDRVEGPLTDPFFIDVDSDCRFVGFGFARDWDPRKRQLVQSLLLTHEFVLPAKPGAQRWRAAQADGMGSFTASYERGPKPRGSRPQVLRHKAAYDGQAETRALGLEISVVGAEAMANFAGEHSPWLQTSTGHERVQIRVDGTVQVDLLQRFRLVRDNAGFVAVPTLAVSDADFGDAFALAADSPAAVDPKIPQMPFDEALHGFLAHFDGTGDPSYAAARQLAAWLKAHPEGAHELVTALRTGAILEQARPALFLALELSGSQAANAALSDVLTDQAFAGLDRARAASALSDIAGPTQATADLLLAQAQRSDDAMVANVSLLGLGKVARHSGDAELRSHVHTTLHRELATTNSASHTRAVLDAMGNTGDTTFADTLAQHLGDDSPATRQHAAQALGRLDPSTATPRLLDQLRNEHDPSVSTAIVGALRGPATTDAISLMTDKLGASTSVTERSAIIAWLGAASHTQPAARSRLVEHFHAETNPRLMQQIGTYLPASALR